MERDSLELTMHPDEESWTMQIGHLNDLFCNTKSCMLSVPPNVPYGVRANNIRLMFMFRDLRELRLHFITDNLEIEQKLIVALGELIALTKLELISGKLAHDIDLSPMSSLNRLQHLKIAPFREYGLVDDDMEELACLTNLTDLSFLASPVGFTQQGIKSLLRMSYLSSLSIRPIGSSMGSRSFEVLRTLPSLTCLTLGIENSSQTVALSQLTWVEHLRLHIADPEADMGNVLSVCNWCLADNLYSLKVGTLEVCAFEFLLSMATLTKLTELRVSFRDRTDPASLAPPTPGDLSALSSLTNMQSFELLCSHNSPVQLSVQGISLLALHWPKLRSLSLSMVGKSGLMQEALDLLDNFVNLEELSLFAAADLNEEEDGPLVGVNLHYLPENLTYLEFELVQLTWLRGSDNRKCRSLPTLRHLELHSCSLSNELLQAWAHDLWNLRHLELICPVGITNSGMSFISQLSMLTYLAVAGANCSDIKQSGLVHTSTLQKLRHLEWSSQDLFTQVDTSQVLPVLCSLTNLHFLALRTSDPLMTGLCGWRTALTSRLPYCVVTINHGLQLYNPWDGYRVAIASDG